MTDERRSIFENWNARRLIFWSILLFAAIVRLKDLSTGLPLHTLYGESDTVDILMKMMRTGDFNPHHYDLPALAYYLYLPFLYCFYFIGRTAGYFTDLASVPPASFVFVGRLVSASFGTATVFLVYRLGRGFSDRMGLFAMAVLAASPQLIEFCHMVRPEIPAIFFALLAVENAMSVIRKPSKKDFIWFGIFSGISFSIKYTIGLPLGLVILLAYIMRRKESSVSWMLQAFLIALAVFLATNPFLFRTDEVLSYWSTRVNTLYFPGEDYYGKNLIFYYLDYLARFDYNVPLLFFSAIGLIALVRRAPLTGITLSLYPLLIFVWLCSFATRRLHGLLPLHPFLALWAAYALDTTAQGMRRVLRGNVFRLAVAILIAVLLFWPSYRAMTQSYLFAQTDNRSKAELWMTNTLPQRSRIALLQFQQIELDPQYFQIDNFAPTDYVFGKKDFRWFREHGYDYIAVSSGQYVRYFTEGQSAQKYRDYFLKLFADGASEGTLILDLATHPLVIPDFRIKVFSTRKLHSPPEFIPALQQNSDESFFHLQHAGVSILLPPGYYSLEIPSSDPAPKTITVTNLKLNEVILEKRQYQGLSAADGERRFPFAILPVKQSSRFSLFSQNQAELVSSQRVLFNWQDENPGLDLKRIEPAIEVTRVEFSAVPFFYPDAPFVLFKKHQHFFLKCTLQNRTVNKVSGYLEGFLSELGEAQPWKDFEAASGIQEFFLDANQSITIEIPMNTEDLTGDHQLSYWIFTRQDLPFSPQNGGWFNKQIRVDDPQLNLHPIYRVSIP